MQMTCLTTNQKVGSSSLFRRTKHRTGAEMPRCIFCLYRFFQSAQTAATIVARAVTAVNPI